MALVSIGLLRMWNFDKQPGHVAATPVSWPVESSIARSQKDTLIVLVHPHCPCSRATIGELGLLMAHCQNRLNTYVLFYRPSRTGPDWTKTDLWRSAAAIPGVQVVSDVDGREARRFGARTSGQVMLYSATGNLLFSGGITIARGHSGDNAGRMAIVSFVNTGEAPLAHTPVYGCSLLGL